jgi:hypothetical protein
MERCDLQVVDLSLHFHSITPKREFIPVRFADQQEVAAAVELRV